MNERIDRTIPAIRTLLAPNRAESIDQTGADNAADTKKSSRNTPAKSGNAQPILDEEKKQGRGHCDRGGIEQGHDK